jgi:Flp pilus assembly protein TadG
VPECLGVSDEESIEPKDVAPDDAGAVMIVFAILLGAGVLFGLLALVADVGQAYLARRDAQNVADLAATSLAYTCVTSPSVCASVASATATAEQIAAANAEGKRVYSTITRVCGPKTDACPAPSTNTYDCRATNAPNYIRVSTTGSSSLGRGIVPLIFAPLIGAGDRTSVIGCSQAAWGQVSTAPIKVPLVFSICSLVPGDSLSIKEWDGSTLTIPCEPNAGYNLPTSTYTGSFYGFLLAKRKPGETSFSTDCSTSIQIRVGDVLQREASSICGKALRSQLDVMIGVPTLVPVARTALGGSGDITIASFAQFTLKGYNIAGLTSGSAPVGGWPAACSQGSSSSGANCVFGTFSSVVVPYQEINYTVANLGTNTVIALP